MLTECFQSVRYCMNYLLQSKRPCYYPHFTDEDIEAQQGIHPTQGHIAITCPKRDTDPLNMPSTTLHRPCEEKLGKIKPFGKTETRQGFPSETNKVKLSRV